MGPAFLVPQPPHSRGAKAAWGLPSLSPSHPTAEGRRQTHDPIIPVDAAPWRGSQAAALRRSMGPAFLVPQPPHSRGAKAAWGLPSLSPSHPTAEGRRQTHDPIIPVDAAPWRGSQAAALRRSMGPAFLVPQPPHSRGAKAAWGLPSLSPSHPTAEGRRQTHDPIISVDAAPWRGSQAAALRRSMGPAFLVPQPPHSRGAKAAWGLPSLSPSHPTAEGRRQTHDPIIPVDAAPWRGSQAAALRRSMGPAFLVPQPPHSRGAKAAWGLPSLSPSHPTAEGRRQTHDPIIPVDAAPWRGSQAAALRRSMGPAFLVPQPPHSRGAKAAWGLPSLSPSHPIAEGRRQTHDPIIPVDAAPWRGSQAAALRRSMGPAFLVPQPPHSRGAKAAWGLPSLSPSHPTAEGRRQTHDPIIPVDAAPWRGSQAAALRRSMGPAFLVPQPPHSRGAKAAWGLPSLSPSHPTAEGRRQTHDPIIPVDAAPWRGSQAAALRRSMGPAFLVPQPPHSRGAKAAWGLPSLSPSHPIAEGRRQTHDPIIPVDAAPWRGSQAAALRRSMGPAFLVPQPPHSRGAKAAWGLPSLSPSHPTAEGRRQTHDPIIPVDAAPWRGSQAAALRRSMGPAFLVPQPPHSRGAKAAWGLPSLSPSHPTAEGRRQTHDPIIPVDAAPWRGSQAAALRRSMGPAFLVPQPPHSRGAKAAWGLPSLSPSHPTAEGRRQTHDPIIPVDAAPWRGSQAAALPSEPE
ncbi:hypothetical protein NDU88_004242 [Pleurodeles waltl]|uniref:Uncharacterized protein n=1 Tax=Pleurodeles waltl TaxID=8319 RepID=A0AAV7V0P1_PLEWA|nr:hypothetical protein NDU88_004242 [Pleurodeles waltl]